MQQLLITVEGPIDLLVIEGYYGSGVFVLVRSSFILEYTPSLLLTILWQAEQQHSEWFNSNCIKWY